jgi:hypothetical protein
MGTARYSLAGAGTNTAALGFGAYPITGATESWNGTNWTEVNDLNTARGYLGGVGTNTAALAFGGYDIGSTTATEEWNAGPATVSFSDA